MYITLIIKFSRKFFFFSTYVFYKHLILMKYFKPPPYTPVQWPI